MVNTSEAWVVTVSTLSHSISAYDSIGLRDQALGSQQFKARLFLQSEEIQTFTEEIQLEQLNLASVLKLG